jgi:3',5'-nucleoside bisphosphate phosphatase
MPVRTAPRHNFVADLHLHTVWSYDGEATIEEVFAAARMHQLKTIAITEHHCVDSVPAVSEIARKYEDIRYIRAAELTVTTSNGDFVDLLCYGFPKQIPAPLQTIFNEYHEWQRRRASSTISGMQKLGYEYRRADHEGILRGYRPPEVLALQGTTHIKHARQRTFFMERGWVKTETDYGPLMQAATEFEPVPYPPVERVVKAVKAAGALVVIAHPTGYFRRTDEKTMDALREECQFDGIECSHSWVTPELQPIYRAYCIKHGLLSTGGSDSHTTEHHLTLMGQYGTPEEWWKEIDERLQK